MNTIKTAFINRLSDFVSPGCSFLNALSCHPKPESIPLDDNTPKRIQKPSLTQSCPLMRRMRVLKKRPSDPKTMQRAIFIPKDLKALWESGSDFEMEKSFVVSRW